MTARKTLKKPVSRPRPSRAEMILRAIENASVDPALINPRAILAGIAIDKKAPATARVAAARVLIAIDAIPSPDAAIEDPAGDPVPTIPDDALTLRALALLNMKGKPN